MKTRLLIGTAGAAGAIVAVGQLTGSPTTTKNETTSLTAAESSEVILESQGGTPDVIVFELFGSANWQSGNQRAYSVGTTSCNIGDVPLNWFANNNQHPVIGQNMFKWSPGQNGHARFEQLGQSWLKHGFCALSQPDCGDCQPTNCDTLGVGCSDPYTAQRNGNQNTAGPKWQVNATTGFFPYPPANPAYSGSMARRLQVDTADVEMGTTDTTRFFFEAQYVCPDENVIVDLIRSSNNASWREANIQPGGNMSGWVNTTQTLQPGIYAWREVDPEVQITWRAINGIGNAYIGSRAFDNGDGTWDYEYAVFNMDMDRSIAQVSIPVDASVNVTNMDFHDVDYHSGEPFSNIDWSMTRNEGDVTFEMSDRADTNGNALRWGTTYNFRFTADSGPTDASMSLEYFKAGEGTGFNADIQGPISNDFCFGDIDESGEIDFADLTALLAEWGFCFECPEDIDGDFVVDFQDLVILLGNWGPCQ